MTASANPIRPRLATSFAWMLGGDLLNKSMRFAATILLARSLSVEDFGAVNVAIAAAGICVVVTSLGLPDLNAQKVAVGPRSTRSIVRTVVAVRVLGTIAVAAVVLGCAAVLAPSSVPVVACAAVMALAMSASTDWALRGTERTRPLGLIWATGGTSLLVGATLVVALKPTPVLALSAFAAAEAVLAGAMLWVLRDLERGGGETPRARAMIREAWPLAVSAVVVYTYYANIDTLILAATRSTREAGLYSGPYRIFLVINVVGVFAAYALSPRLARRSQQGGGFEEAGVVLSLLAGFGLFVAAGAILGGEELLRVSLGGPFAVMAPTFALLCLAVAWYSTGYPVGYSLIAQGRNRQFMTGAATAGAVNVVLNVALIPPLGAIAAGASTTVSFATAAIIWLRLSDLDVAVEQPLFIALATGSTLCVGALVLPDLAWLFAVGIAVVGAAVSARALRLHRHSHSARASSGNDAS